MSSLIAQLVQDCKRLFDSLRNLCEDRVFNTLSLDEFTRFDHENNRFVRWSRNTGAYKDGIYSLESQLKDSSHVRLQVVRLLNHIKRLLDDANSIAVGEEVPWDQIDEDEFSSSDDEENPIDKSPNTEIEQITMHIAELIESLSDLCVATRNPAPHDRITNSTLTQMTHFEPFDILHVSSKYPRVDSGIAERLGKAITTRRQFLKHREGALARKSVKANHQKYSDINTADLVIPEDDEARFNLRELILPGDESDEVVFESSCATSEAGQGGRQIPALPTEASQGVLFECPYCYITIRVTSNTAWKKHIFDDLRPYICLEKDCTTPHHQYSRRKHWMNHVLEDHWETYTCPFGCGLKFSTSTNCREHLRKDHKDHGVPENPAEMDDLIRLCTINNSEVPIGTSCPICKKAILEIKEYRSHVGRHQEQLALFALSSTGTGDRVPQAITDTEESEVESTSLDPGVQSTGSSYTADTSAGGEGSVVGERFLGGGGSSGRKGIRFWTCCHCAMGWQSVAINSCCMSCQVPRCGNCTYA